MNLSETAFLRAVRRGRFDLRWFTPDRRGRAVRPRDARVARTRSGRPVGFAAESDRSVRDAQRRALGRPAGADRIELDFPAPSRCRRRPTDLLDALGLRADEIVAHRHRVTSSSSSTTHAVRDLAPDFAALGRSPTARGLRHRAGRRAATTSSRGSSRPRIGIDEDPVTGSAHCALGPVLGHAPRPDELGATRRRNAGGEVEVVRKGDRVLLTGRASTVSPGSYALCDRCQASWRSMPSRSDTSGSQPSSSRARSIAPPLRNASPGWRGCVVDRHRRARELADERDQFVERDLARRRRDCSTCRARRRGRRPARFAAHDVGDVGELADLRAVAEARERAPSSAASHSRWIDMSGRWRGPNTVK